MQSDTRIIRIVRVYDELRLLRYSECSGEDVGEHSRGIGGCMGV